MRDYNVRWLVLESDQIVPALEPVLTGTDQARLAVAPGRDRRRCTTGPSRRPDPRQRGA